MCQVSDKIRFCSCAAGEKNKLKNKWVLHRLVPGKAQEIMGDTILPADWSNPMLSKLNAETLQNRLNDPDAFDMDVKPKDLDRLEISFSLAPESEGYLEYVFEYRAGKWKNVEWKAFHLENHFRRINSGKVDSPFISKSAPPDSLKP